MKDRGYIEQHNVNVNQRNLNLNVNVPLTEEAQDKAFELFDLMDGEDAGIHNTGDSETDAVLLSEGSNGQ